MEDKILENVKKIEERFLSADYETGKESLDNPDYGENELAEVEAFVEIVLNEIQNASIVIDQLLKNNHLQKLKILFGSDAEKILSDAQSSLKNVHSLFSLEKDAPVEEPVQEPKEEPEDSKQGDVSELPSMQ